jgi:hypothetical protein
VSADNPLAIDPQLTDYLRQRLQAEAEAAERRQLDRIAAAVQRAWDRAADLTTSKRLRDVRRRIGAGEAPTEHTEGLTRAVFARRVALLGRVLARTFGTAEAAAWWRGMARDPLERSLVAWAVAGRPEPVRGLLEAVRGVQVTVYNDVRLWLGLCAEAVRRRECPAAGGEGLGAVVETPTPAAAAPPRKPAADYCLIPPRTIRWRGECEVQPRVYTAFARLLETHANCNRMHFDSFKRDVLGNGEMTDKTVQNRVSELTEALTNVSFPWSLRTSDRHVIIDRRC